MSPRTRSHRHRLTGIGLCAATLALALATPARAEIIPVADMMRGISMSAAQCAAKPDTVWVSAYGRSFCIRYYLSTAGGEGRQPVVFLQGDKLGPYNLNTRTFTPGPDEKDVDTDALTKWAEGLSKRNKTTGIYLARVGIDGSSGYHGVRRTMLELHALNAALDAIKRKHQFEGFHLMGQSGGAGLIGGLLALRQDITCAVPGSGGLTVPNKNGPHGNPTLQFFDPSEAVPAIARNRTARILVVTDPADQKVPVEKQVNFVRKLRHAGGQVEQFFVEATDPLHHGVAAYASFVVSECMRGTSTPEISIKLAQLVQKRLAWAKADAEAKAKAKATASNPPHVPNAPAANQPSRAGSVSPPAPASKPNGT